jgi:pyridoxine 5-phosphate synthase
MLKLGVNIDHVATLREARYRGRGFGEPDPVAAARICEAAGAHGITAHLREDRRHIQNRDIWKLRETVKTRLNLELANVPEIVGIALKLKPDIVCLVPERRLEVTTEGGLDVAADEKALTETRKKMNDAGIEVSLFIAPDEKQIEASSWKCTPARLRRNSTNGGARASRALTQKKIQVRRSLTPPIFLNSTDLFPARSRRTRSA